VYAYILTAPQTVKYRANTKEWCGIEHNILCQQRELSTLLMLTAGPRDQYPRWRRSRKRLSVCYVYRCPDL
jgi:hypothetical protein